MQKLKSVQANGIFTYKNNTNDKNNTTDTIRKDFVEIISRELSKKS